MKQQYNPLMKQFALAFCCMCLLSCTKEDTASMHGTKLLKAISTDTSGSISTVKFTYDDQGRINSYTHLYGSRVSKSATITYIGNTIFIDYKPITDLFVRHFFSVTYILNEQQQPVQRIQYDSSAVEESINGQINLRRDTSFYTYDVSGFVTRIAGTQHDSVRISSMGRFISQLTQYSYGIGMSGALPTTLQLDCATSYRYIENGTETKGNWSGGETYTFGYTNQFANNLDFSNALLFSEFGIFYPNRFPMNPGFRYLPDKIVFSSARGNAFGLPEFSYFPHMTVGTALPFVIDYHTNGFIGTISGSRVTEYIYSE